MRDDASSAQHGWWSELLALLAGLALRAVFVSMHPRFVGDTLVYGDLAQNMLAHHVYGLTEDGRVRATLIRLPGYPAFLAMCFTLFGVSNYLAVVWVQVGVDLLGCWLLSKLAARLFGQRVSLWVLWLAALCPFTANYAAAALTETLSIFCVIAAFWGLVAWRDAPRSGRAELAYGLIVGTALTWAVMLRPDGILLAGAVLPAMAWGLWRSRRGLTASPRPYGFVAAAVLLVFTSGAWTARNWRVYHVVQPLAPKYANDPGESAPLGFARWYRTWGAGLTDTTRVYWEYDGSTLRLADLPPWAFDSADQRADTARLYARYNAETSSTPEIEAAFARLASERIRAHPLRYWLLMPLVRLGDMWLRPRTELLPHMPLDWWKFPVRPKASLFSAAYGLLNVALLAAGIAGLLRWRRMGWEGSGVVAAAMVGFVLLRSGLLLTIDNSEPRYVLECYPVVILLAGLAIARPGRQAEERSERENWSLQRLKISGGKSVPSSGANRQGEGAQR